MRRFRFTLALLVLASLAAAAPAKAARVLVVGKHGVHAYDERALDGARTRTEPASGGQATAIAAAHQVQPSSMALASRSDAVQRAIKRAFAHAAISADEQDGYLSSYGRALSTYRGLSGIRRSELGYVIGVIQLLARSGQLGASRMPALFLILDRNREWWAKAGPPASGARLRFGSSRVIFQYFPGRGLQFHPLANFGLLNGYWQGHRDSDLRSLADDLVKLRVNRGGFGAWEYYFAFGGGSPPWISGMAQGTAMQALTRASQRLADPNLLKVARDALGSFERRTPIGTRVPDGPGAWYALYSFDPHQNVLNGMLQAINGLRTYADYANDERAMELFKMGDRLARSVIAKYDTGAWSLYSRPFGRPGPEADLNYHTLNRDFARKLCNATGAEIYCNEADDFSRYLKEDPTLDPFGAYPSPARASRGVKFRFKLSKVGTVGITVRVQNGDGSPGRTYLSTSASFMHGEHFFSWVPPRFRNEHTYQYKLFARDLAGNTNSQTGTIRVKPAG